MRAQSLVLFLSTEFPLYLLTTGYVSAEPTSRLRATEQQQQLQKNCLPQSQHWVCSFVCHFDFDFAIKILNLFLIWLKRSQGYLWRGVVSCCRCKVVIFSIVILKRTSRTRMKISYLQLLWAKSEKWNLSTIQVRTFLLVSVRTRPRLGRWCPQPLHQELRLCPT